MPVHTKQVISSLGDYLTASGGVVNLKQVDVIMAEVGEIEDEVFRRRKVAETKDQVMTEEALLFLKLSPPSYLNVSTGIYTVRTRCAISKKFRKPVLNCFLDILRNIFLS